MKKYIIEIFIDENSQVMVHEKADGLVLNDLRLVSSIFAEYHLRQLNAIVAMTTMTPNKAPEQPKENN